MKHRTRPDRGPLGIIARLRDALTAAESSRDGYKARCEALEADMEERTQRVVDLESEMQEITDALSDIKTMKDMGNVSLQRIRICVKRLESSLAATEVTP